MVPWPVGTGAKGNDGIAQAVKQTKNSISYVEFAQALQAKLSLRRDQEPLRRMDQAGSEELPGRCGECRVGRRPRTFR